MEPAKIDWKNVRSRFVEDEIYERINAPKWFDFSDPEKFVEDDDEAWFCTPHCQHPKTAEDFVKSMPTSSKMKHLRSISVSEIVVKGDRVSGDSSMKRVALKNAEKPSKEVLCRTPERSQRNRENSNPNFSPTPGHGSKYLKSPANSAKPKLKSTLSASNLFSGRFDPIKEFCNELKKLVIGAKAREKAKMDEENVQLVSSGLSDESLQSSDENERGNELLLEVEKEISGAVQASGKGEKHGTESCGDSNDSGTENKPLLEIKKDNSNTMQKKKKEHRRYLISNTMQKKKEEHRRINDAIENIPENLREVESREENIMKDRTPPSPQCLSNSKMPPRPVKTTSTPLKPCRSRPKLLRKEVFFNK